MGTENGEEGPGAPSPLGPGVEPERERERESPRLRLRRVARARVDALVARLPPRVRGLPGGVMRARAALQRGLDRVDPNDDPDAEKLGALPLFALAVALYWSASLYWRFKFQPMQDLGHHVGMSAIVADYWRKGSLFTELYDAPNPLNANSLLYFVAGPLGRVVGVTNAVRACMTFYVVGVPLANLYALRVFGRSAWPAVLSVPLVYNMNYVAGFANLLFAAPFLVIAIPLFYRAIVRPSWQRVALVAFVLVCVFLSHAHAFLWAGALTISLTLGTMVVRLVEKGVALRERAANAAVVAGAALLSALPSLLLFARWYEFAFGEGKTEGSVTAVTSGLDQGYGAYFKPTSALLLDLYNYAAKTLISDDDSVLNWKLSLLVFAGLALARLHAWRRPPVMEAAFVLTMTSYFLLPEAIDTNPVVGSRQVGVALWMVAAMVTPVPKETSRLARYLMIALILWYSRAAMRTWQNNLYAFEATEANGLEFVMEPAPYRQRLHEVKVASDFSKIFTWKPLWHVDKFYMADRFGQVADNPAIVSTSSIRYKSGVDPHRVTFHTPDWPKLQEIWDNNELVLVHGWTPTDAQLAEAKKHALRLRKEGDWELWRKKGTWQETGDGPIPNL